MVTSSFNLETAVGQVRVRVFPAFWQGATTPRTAFHKEEQRGQGAGKMCNRACSAAYLIGERVHGTSIQCVRTLAHSGKRSTAVSRFKRAAASLIAVLFVVLSMPAFASVEATVDRNPVELDQSFTLTVQSSEDGEPDLKPLQQDFDIVGRSKSSSYQIINGNSSHTTSWQIALMPKHTGQIRIPPLTINGQSSDPITLTVVAAGTAQGRSSQQGANLFVEVSAVPTTAYVQQQMVFSVRLYRNVDLADGSSLSEPKFPNADAVIEKLGQDREFQTIRNGERYAVIERRYAVYPQKSGQFAMDPIEFDGNVVDNTQNNGGFFAFGPFNQSTRHVRAHSAPLRIAVKPEPAQFDGRQWLPAASLTLAETWSQNPPVFTVGEPITRTLTVTAKGLNASQLPQVGAGSLDGFKLYPDQPDLKDEPGGNGITGIRTEKVALIPTRPGKLELPAIEIKWWNTHTDKEEIARIPARSVTVVAGSNAATPPEQPPSPTATSSASPLSSSGMVQPRIVDAGWWPWLSLVLGLGWFATALAWWLSHARKTPATPTKKHRPQETLKHIEEKLKKACDAGDAAQATTQLIAWAKLTWPKNPPASLTAIARACEPALAEALINLDKTRYADVSEGWNGEEFWRIFVAHRPAANVTRKSAGNSLPSLYGDAKD